MIAVIASWIIIGCAALIVGCGLILVTTRYHIETFRHLDIYMTCGLMAITVYAQLFSIIYKVSTLACVCLFLVGIFFAIVICISLKKGKKLVEKREYTSIDKIKWLAVGWFIVAMTVYTVVSPQHCDTPLYHAQAIRWCEEYGIVPGLGNLHNRFGYNSAFMPLQALFSFKWLLGQSLHSLNGFICCFFGAYAIASNHLLRDKEHRLSDLLKMLSLVYIFINRGDISSPASDTLAMLLVIYIFTKWSEFLEKRVESVQPWIFLSLLGVWAVSVKLSTGMIVLLAVYPATLLIKKKQWKTIVLSIVSGIIIIFPWLTRNVIISGYLLYPYAQIDLFQVDWKIPASVLTFDSREIMIYGRGYRDVAMYSLPFWKWSTNWFAQLRGYEQFIMLVAGISLVILVLQIIRNICQREQFCESMLIISCISGFSLWWFSAPLIRYGIGHVLVVIGVAVYFTFRNTKWGIINLIIYFTMIPILCILLGETENIIGKPMIYQEDYQWHPDEEIAWNGIKVWVPTEGVIGYSAFPSAGYKDMLDKIELRGNNIQDGFRIKKEYKDMQLKNDGTAW